jgi:hypothetical protein
MDVGQDDGFVKCLHLIAAKVVWSLHACVKDRLT